MYKKILVPLDGSDVASAIVPYVSNLAKRLSASVTFFVCLGARAAGY